MKLSRLLATTLLLATSLASWSQDRRKIIIDEDGAGPGGTDQQAILILIQSHRRKFWGSLS